LTSAPQAGRMVCDTFLGNPSISSRMSPTPSASESESTFTLQCWRQIKSPKRPARHSFPHEPTRGYRPGHGPSSSYRDCCLRWRAMVRSTTARLGRFTTANLTAERPQKEGQTATRFRERQRFLTGGANLSRQPATLRGGSFLGRSRSAEPRCVRTVSTWL
jgi:hypothetical protein